MHARPSVVSACKTCGDRHVVSANDNTKERIAELRKFISDTRLAGRAEIEPLGDIVLSIVDPERYRYDIRAKIADENAQMIQARRSRGTRAMGTHGCRGAQPLFASSNAEITGCAYEQ